MHNKYLQDFYDMYVHRRNTKNAQQILQDFYDM